MQNKESPCIIEKCGIYITGIISAALSLFLTVNSLLHTTAMEIVRTGEGKSTVVYNIRESMETVIYYNDDPLLNMILLGVSLLVCFAALSKLHKLSLKTLIPLLFIWTTLLGTAWVISSQTAPTHDSGMITNTAMSLAMNDYTPLTDEIYFKCYPFQLGYVLFNEAIFRVIALFMPLQTPEAVLTLASLNAIFLSISYTFLLLINHLIFGDRRMTLLTALLLAVNAAPVISCSFIYGIYPGMMFALAALYFELVFLKKGSLACAAVSALSIGIAVCIKQNYIIWLIAMILTAVVGTVKKRDIPFRKYIPCCLYITAALILALSLPRAVQKMYETRSGADFGEGIPYTSWIAMGLSEGLSAPGWYNQEYTTENFGNAGLSAKAAAGSSRRVIKERLTNFIKDPRYAKEFFYKKTVSQWNETSYQSIWQNTVRIQYKDKAPLAECICGKGAPTVKGYMDIYAQLIFAAFFTACLSAIRRKNFFALTLPLIFIGGYMYHFISEGKSQYILPYFILMTAAGSYGIVRLYDILLPRLSSCKLLIPLLSVRKSKSEQGRH